jgi:hypothetical protein
MHNPEPVDLRAREGASERGEERKACVGERKIGFVEPT